MVFLYGLNLPERSLVKGALQSFYGIGPNICARLMARFYIHETATLGNLSEKQLLDINGELTNMTIENDLKREVRGNILRLRNMGAHRGRRHAMSLPVRGQRTRTQTATAKKLNRVVWHD